MPFAFGACQECHGITVDQFDLREVDSDDTAFLERGAKDIQVFPGDPTADAKNHTLFNQHAGRFCTSWSRSCCPDASLASRTPAAIRRKCSKNARSSRLRLVDLADLADLADLVDLVNLVDTGGASAKLELRFVDVQCLDAMVKRGWWNAELRRRS